ncbi:MAG TPA: alpha/beta hydrolase [Aggregatilineaceae bacterium]|nr:alpha/beta hydrolase [Aggregatilineaceae bacterium]
MSDPVVARRTIEGLSVGTAVIGEGRPVVALHGWGGAIRSFWPVAEQLTPRGYQVHVLDLPGFGASDLPPAPWGVRDYSRFVRDYLDAARLECADLLGHSFGGRISLVLAAEHPDRVRKLVLASSAGIPTTPSASQRLRTAGAQAVRDTLDRLGLDGLRARLQHRYHERYASEDYRNAGPLRETFLRVISEDLTPFAQRVQAPTVLIWGDQDADTPLWQGRRLEALIPDAGLIVFQGAGHFAYLERLLDYVRIVDHFLGAES